MNIRKEETTLSLFVCGAIVCLDKSKKCWKNKHGKVANMTDYKLNTQNSRVFLHVKNSKENNEIKDSLL